MPPRKRPPVPVRADADAAHVSMRLEGGGVRIRVTVDADDIRPQVEVSFLLDPDGLAQLQAMLARKQAEISNAQTRELKRWVMHG